VRYGWSRTTIWLSINIIYHVLNPQDNANNLLKCVPLKTYKRCLRDRIWLRTRSSISNIPLRELKNRTSQAACVFHAQCFLANLK